MKKVTTIFIIFILAGGIFFILSPSVSSDGISVWPPKITIDINDWDYDDPIHQKIEINNLNSHDIYAKIVIGHPIPYRRDVNYEEIPSLSWITAEPDLVFIPAYESRFVEVFIALPEEEKQQYYDKNWEVWVNCYEDVDEDDAYTMFRVKLAVKFFINTPSKPTESEFPQFPFLLLLLIIGGFIVSTLVSHILKKRRSINMKKSAIFYVKEKNRNETVDNQK